MLRPTRRRELTTSEKRAAIDSAGLAKLERQYRELTEKANRPEGLTTTEQQELRRLHTAIHSTLESRRGTV